MSVLNPKTRLVSFRLSQEEYAELCALCAAQRARSISDFVRDNMHWILERGEDGGPVRACPLPAAMVRPETAWMAREAPSRELSAISEMLVSLHRRTDELDRRMRQLAQLVQAVAGEAKADESRSISG